MKKIGLFAAALVVVVAGVAAMSAWEAHIINVTAHIENALAVHPKEINFGTVFPQEYLEEQFTVQMSESFTTAERAESVSYKIVQKPKCINDAGEYAPVDYATHLCPEGYEEMLSLCPYLSKMDGDPEDANDRGVPSYFQGTSCIQEDPGVNATGVLSKTSQDFLDLWIVDLKVPPIDGTVGQEWPEGCPTLAEDSQDYGCDLWIEVTNIGGLVD